MSQELEIQEKQKEIALHAVRALYAKQASKIELYHVSERTTIADYFLLCNGRASTHLHALADDLHYQMEQIGVHALRTEGRDGGLWILVDFGSVIVHIFSSEAREFYNLERLQAPESQIDLTEIFRAEDEKNGVNV